MEDIGASGDRLMAIRKRVEEATKADVLYGGELLKETCLAVSGRIEGNELSCLGIDEADWLDAWEKLVDEVVTEYCWERIILEHELELNEFRPRTFFSVLPGSEELGDNGDVVSVSEMTVRYKRIEVLPEMKQGTKTKRLSVLLPVANGYRKTFRSLACLCYDVEELLREYDIEFHICVNFSDDNSFYEVTRFANTVARSFALPIIVYLAENPKRMGHRGGKGRWWKTDVLNVMLRNILENHQQADPEKEHYLHFGDDDIFIPPGAEVIPNNIKALSSQGDILKMICACYSSKEDMGFSAVSSVRKRPEYIQWERPGSKRPPGSVPQPSMEAKGMVPEEILLNIYGGCMTTTIKGLREILGQKKGRIELPRASQGEAFGEDSYLAIKANLAALRKHDPESGSQAVLQELRGCATRRMVVGHQEPTNIVSFAKRVARDYEWGERSVQKCIEEDGIDPQGGLEKVFSDLRRESYSIIKDAILSAGNPRHILAQIWSEEIRREARAWVGNHPSARFVNWATHKTQHQICKDIVEDRHVFERIIQSLKRGPFGYALIHSLRTGASDPAERFPEMSRLLIALDRKDIEADDRKSIDSVINSNAYLFHWQAIAQESIAYGLHFMDATGGDDSQEMLLLGAERIETLKKQYPFNLGQILAHAFRIERGRKVTVVPKDSPSDEEGSIRTTDDASITYRCWRPSQSPRSYTVFLKRDPAQSTQENTQVPHELFLRYFTVIGRTKFVLDSPRRTVCLHVLGEEVINRARSVAQKIDGSRKDPASAQAEKMKLVVARTLYPVLRESMLNYAGPERRAPFDRLMQSLFIQESLSERAKQLSAIVLDDNHSCQLAECMAAFLGEVHGVSFGIRSYLDRLYNEEDTHFEDYRTDENRCALIKLLIEHLDKVRLFTPNAYRQWLEKGADSPGAISILMQDIQEERGLVGLEVAQLLRQDGLELQGIWRDLCENSIQVHTQYGAIGHQGLYPENLFIGFQGQWERTELQGRKINFVPRKERLRTLFLANHAGLAMIDPAIEAGSVLAELISARLAASSFARTLGKPGYRTDDGSLPAIMDAFRYRYSEAFQRFLHTDGSVLLSKGHDKDDRRLTLDLVTRLSHWAAVSLLIRFHDKKEYDLTADERERLFHICLDLLHIGTSLKVRFRDSPPSYQVRR